MMWLVLSVALFVVWGVFLYALHKRKLEFFKFLVGSIGTFSFLVLWFRNAIYYVIDRILMEVLYWLGNVTHSFVGYVQASTVTVFHQQQTLSFFVSYECSGVIELMVFLSLLFFYPTFSSKRKIKFFFIGLGAVIVGNLFRLLFIIYSDKLFGNGVFFLSHMVIGRLFYYSFIIALYYVVFTKPHVEGRNGVSNRAS